LLSSDLETDLEPQTIDQLNLHASFRLYRHGCRINVKGPVSRDDPNDVRHPQAEVADGSVGLLGAWSPDCGEIEKSPLRSKELRKGDAIRNMNRPLDGTAASESYGDGLLLEMA
jgi:hypothetical protein